MSKDIRSFFNVSSKKIITSNSTAPVISTKRPVISSDEDEPKTSPNKLSKHNKKTPKRSPKINHTKKRRIIESDEDISPNKNKNSKSPHSSKINENPNLIPINITDAFGSEPAKRFDLIVEKIPKSSPNKSIGLFDDDLELDLDILEKSEIVKNATYKKSMSNKSPGEYGAEKNNESSNKHAEIECGSDIVVNSKTYKKEKDKSVTSKFSDDSDINPDEERFEKKRYAAMLYQKYKNRSGPINPGSKAIPKGKSNCLIGLTFIISGVMESLERDEVSDIIKKYGGKVMSTLSKKTNFMIVGDDAGPAKLAKAEELRTTLLSEDEFLNLIRQKSGQSTKNQEKEHPKTENFNSGGSINTTPPKIKTQKIVISSTPLTSMTLKSPSIKKSPTKLNSPTNDDLQVELKTENISPKKQQPKMIEQNKLTKRQVESIGKEVIPQKRIKSEPIEDGKSVINASHLAWVDKYKPTGVKEIIGQQGAASNCVKLMNWLTKWHSNHGSGKKKLQRPNPWAKNDDGSYFKAALLSGPPGIGKTTTAMLVCKEFGYDTVEFNASDTRSKKLLKEEVSELLSNQSLFGYFHGDSNSPAVCTKKHVLIMDEVDGMAGNEDRGGIQELIQLIKDAHIPIICMCNDRNHQKMRSLVNYCYDLRFQRPRLEQIKGAMMSVCFKENIKLPKGSLDDIISSTNNDIRQTLNYLSMISANNALPSSSNNEYRENSTAKKDLKLGPWDVVRKVFAIDEHANMSFNDKSDLFFHDYNLAPLFVQQNYLMVKPKCPQSEIKQRVAATADSLSLGDLVEKRIRTNMAWSLLPLQAMYSSVLPGEYMAGYLTAQINFPAWLGKNSKTTKRSRLAQELHDHTRICTSASRLSIRLDYAPFLLQRITKPLQENGVNGVTESLAIIKEYRLLREDIDSLVELTQWPGGRKNPMDTIDGKVKAALTRTYNKEVAPYTYTATAAIKKKKSDVLDDYAEEILDDVAQQSASDDDNDNMENDVLIKAKRKDTSKATSSKKLNGNTENVGKKATVSTGRAKKLK